MKTRSGLFLVVLMVAGGFLPPPVAAQTALGKVADALALFNQSLIGLDGKVADHVDQQEAIWFAVARRLASHPDLAELVGREALNARRSGQTNQQQVFLLALVAVACKNFDDGCALRAEIAGIQLKDEEQDRRLDRLEQLTPGGPQRHGGYYRGPADPIPAPDSAPREQPSSRIWRYGIDRITHLQGSLCPTAQLIERCVEVPVAGGYYHGDLYEDCSGRIVLVRHVKTAF
jgi:hypothetical protein